MQITVIGAGVVGTTYAWQLAQGGHQVSLVVKPEQQASLSHGIAIDCLDQRRRRKTLAARFHPRLHTSLEDAPEPEMVFVCVQRQQRQAVLPELATLPDSTTIAFFQQVWHDREAIEQWIAPDRYVLGDPAVGGGRDRRGVFCWLHAEPTRIGAPDAHPSARVKLVAAALRTVGLKVDPYTTMEPWMAARAATRTALAGGILKAGGVGAFLKRPDLMQASIMAAREGLEICTRLDYPIRDLSVARAYLLPLDEARRALERTLNRDTARVALGGCLANTLPELRSIANDIISAGQSCGVSTPNLAVLRAAICSPLATYRFVQHQPETNGIPRAVCPLGCANPCIGHDGREHVHSYREEKEEMVAGD